MRSAASRFRLTVLRFNPVSPASSSCPGKQSLPSRAMCLLSTHKTCLVVGGGPAAEQKALRHLKSSDSLDARAIVHNVHCGGAHAPTAVEFGVVFPVVPSAALLPACAAEIISDIRVP